MRLPLPKPRLPAGQVAAHDQGGRLNFGNWLVMCAAGLCILVLTAVFRQAPAEAGWYVAHVIPGVAVAAFSTASIGRRVGGAFVVSYAAFLPIATLAVGYGLINPWNDGTRISLFTDSPNLLAADIVAVTLAAMALHPRRAWKWWLPVVLLAVFFTGSRTALLALAAAGATWMVISASTTRSLLRRLGGVLPILLIFTCAIVQESAIYSSPNLLSISSTFVDRSWRHHDAAQVLVKRKAETGPLAGTRAELIEAVLHGHATMLTQRIAVSVTGTPYVASVFLRADYPVDIVLSTHLSRTTCHVSASWQRCVTPPGHGDGINEVQFRLEATAPASTITFYASAPQLEIGTSPTAYTERGRMLFPSVLIERYRATPWDRAPLDRWQLTASRLEEFVRRPWLGSGHRQTGGNRIGVEDASPKRNAVAGHAHNLLVELLARDGMVGLVGWLILSVPVAFAGFRAVPTAVAPFLVGLVILNSLDMTLFHSGSYFASAFIAGAICIRSGRTDRLAGPI